MLFDRGCLRLLLPVAMLVCAQWAQASVVMTGTRVIFPAGLKTQNLQFHNPDTHPNVVQLWLDDGDLNATPDAATTPFLALPQIFRVEPKTGQMVRLLLADASGLPQDRESVFYLNFSQLPARKKTAEQPNELLLMFTSRVKVFYRPSAIDANLPGNIAQQLQLAWRDGAVHVHNPTPYHVVVRQADALAGADAQPAPLLQAGGDMIAPFADVTWQAVAVAGKPQSVRLVMVNDYGADVVADIPVP